MIDGLRIIITGLIAQYPVGGVTWDYIQYVLGLAQLGHDVFYFEDSGQWPYNPAETGGGQDCVYNVAYLNNVMTTFAFQDRWAYHFPGGILPSGKVLPSEWFGMTEAKRKDVLRSADLLINVSAGIGCVDSLEAAKRLVFIDSDPGFTQVRLALGDSLYRQVVDSHDIFFSFGECLSDPVPALSYVWKPTRQPVVLSEWHSTAEHRNVFTTVMNWASYKPMIYKGRAYGHKDLEFIKFIDLPRLAEPCILEVAISAGEVNRLSTQFLIENGWLVRDARDVSADWNSYRDYIQSSMAEWSVAKNGYVVSQSGWFSCRSACYLAAGRPVVVQETGWSRVLPKGKGILGFEDPNEAAEAVREVAGNHAYHARAAREIAEEYFNAKHVLSHLIEQSQSCAEYVRPENANEDIGCRLVQL